MKTRLVTDCAANICQKVDKEIAYVPLVITTDDREFRDDENLDVSEMMEYLKNKKRTSDYDSENLTYNLIEEVIKILQNIL